MAVQAQYLAYVLEQLESLPAVRANRMFGGIGLYSDGLFFGLIDDDTLFFKTSEQNAADYLARGMPKFMPFPERPSAVMGYHQVPADVIEDAETLVRWARRSVAVALASKSARPVAGKRSAAAPGRRRPAAKPARRKAKTSKTPVRRK